MNGGERHQDGKARARDHGEPPCPNVEPRAPGHQRSQSFDGAIVDHRWLLAGIPFDVDHRKGEAAARDAQDQAEVADEQADRLHHGRRLAERIDAADHHQVGERGDDDGVEAQQHRGLRVEHAEHARQPLPGQHAGLLLGRAVDLQARHRQRVGRRTHPRSALMLAAYFVGPPANTAVPATSASAPAARHCLAVCGLTPPSTSRSIGLPSASIALRRAAILASWLSMKAWPPKPGLTLITSTRSRSPSTFSMAARGVAGLSTQPARLPCCLISWTGRWTCGPASGWNEMVSAPASAKAGTSGSTGVTIRWTSNGSRLCGRSAFTTTGPIV